MKKLLNKLLTVSSSLLLVGSLTTPLLAEEPTQTGSNTVAIASTSISVESLGETDSDTKFTYEIKFVDKADTDSSTSGNLRGKESDQYIENPSLELSTGESGQFNLDFYVMGNYSYEITQITESPDGNYGDYKKGSETTYTVDVYVSTDEVGAYHTDTVLYEDGGTEKCDSAKFYNFSSKKEPTVTPTPKPSEPTAPTDNGGTTNNRSNISGKATDTSDSSSIYMWGGLAFLGLFGVITVLFIRNKELEKELEKYEKE